MKHLCTGSKGFLGRHLMRALGDDAIGVDLPECDVRRTSGAGVDWQYSPISQKTFRTETVWHLAALNDATQTFYDRPWDVLNTQIRGTLNVIDSCVENKVGTLVLFSSSEVYQAPQVIPTPEDVPLVVPDLRNPRYSYGGGKIAAELLAWHSKIPRVIIIRPHNVYGPGQRGGHVIPDLIARIDAAEKGAIVPVHGDSRSTRAYCYVDDFIRCVTQLAARHGEDEKTREVYHVGDRFNTVTGMLANLIAGALGRDDVGFSYTSDPPGSPMIRRPDINKMVALGIGPKVSLREGLAKTIAWHREQTK